ncbi:MAG: NUDIX hydrolase [Alphaproteobacteria bacterium]
MDTKAAYKAMREKAPELFKNAASGGIDILSDDETIAQAEALRAAIVEDGAPDVWRQCGLLYRDAFVTILKDPVRFPDGRLSTYSRVLMSRESQRSVAIFPMREGKCVLMREYRHAIRRFNWGIPRGMPENGATLEEDARREVQEEIGAEVVRLEPLGVIAPEPGFTGYDSALFLAEVVGSFKGQTTEAISEIIEISPGELAAKIASGEITDGFVLGAFAKLVAMGKIQI